MRKGFTLVELLAVIVILAVIALITIPAVMKMIDTSTINSYRRSIDLYGRAVNNGIISYESDMVEKGKKIDITFENIDSYIEYEGNDVDCKDKTIYSDRTILLTECTVQEELVHAEKGRGYGEENYYYYTNSRKKMKLIKYIEAVEEAIQGKNISGTCTIGEDKITCNNEDITIKSKLENAIEGNLVIENNKVKSYSNLRFETEKKVETNNEVPQVIDEQNTSNNNQEINYKGYSIGDKITYKGADYYVIETSDSAQNYVVLLKDKPLTADEVTNLNSEYAKVNGYWGVHKYEETGEKVAQISYSVSTNCYMSDHSGGDSSSCYDNYDDSDIKHVVDDWTNNNFEVGELKQINDYKSRLLMLQEIQSLSNDFAWKIIQDSRYWTMTSTNDNSFYGKLVWVLCDNGEYEKMYTYNVAAIRPVINLKKEFIN